MSHVRERVGAVIVFPIIEHTANCLPVFFRKRLRKRMIVRLPGLLMFLAGNELTCIIGGVNNKII
jgi:hypothetical protein